MICWCCKKAEMRKVEDDRGFHYLKCPKCGATDTGKLPLFPIPQTWEAKLAETTRRGK